MRATKAQIEEGRRKKGLYETISVLGRGTSGTVKLCRFRPSQELVALKSIAKPQNGSDTEGKGAEDSFWKEVNALRKTGLHVNLAQLLDAFETSTKWYLVLAYQSGGDLLKRIERSGVFTEQSAATIILTILNSLHYLHAHGIVHRDVKPANLLMKDTSANAALVLVDFGSSFSGKASKQTTGMDEKSAMRTIAGTPFYLAPEIVKGQVYNEKVDIWSVGCIAYQLLCGQTPFQGASGFQNLYDRIQRADYVFPPSKKLPISEQAKDFIKSLLVADPTKRPTALKAMAHPWFSANVPVCYFVGFFEGLLLKMYNHEADPLMFEGPTAADATEYDCPVLVQGFAAVSEPDTSKPQQPDVPARIASPAMGSPGAIQLSKPLRAGWEQFGKPGVFQIPRMEMPDSFYQDLVKHAPQPGAKEESDYDAELLDKAVSQSGFVWSGQFEQIVETISSKYPGSNLLSAHDDDSDSFFSPSPIDKLYEDFPGTPKMSPRSDLFGGGTPMPSTEVPGTPKPGLGRISTDSFGRSSSTLGHSVKFQTENDSHTSGELEEGTILAASDPKLEHEGTAILNARRPSEVVRVKSLVTSLASFGMGSAR